MSTTAYWSPNQAAVAQVETYTFTAPSSIGNTYNATINGKTVTYSSVSGDTAALAATALFNLLNVSTSIAPELTEITFANPSSGVVTATAKAPGTPFANVAGTSAGLVLSTGNGLVGGIATVHTTANASPSDVNDAQNWLRVTSPAPGVRQIPQNGDDVVVANSSVPLLWNLGQLAAVQFNTYTRWQSFTGTIGLPENNPSGYTEWRATYFKFVGPQGSVPSGGLQVVLGYSSTGGGSGPTRERYDFGSQKTSVQALAAGSPADEFGIRILGVHTDNVINALSGVSIGVATLPGETSKLNTVVVESGARVAMGAGVTWATSSSGLASSLTAYGGSVILNSAPATTTLNNGARATFSTDALTWPIITVNGSSAMTWLAGGTITTLTMTSGSSLDKSGDGRLLTITNSTIDGDSCFFIDPLNSITWTNATIVKQQVVSGPFQFTGSKTVKVT